MDTNMNREWTPMDAKKAVQPQINADLGITESIGWFTCFIVVNALKVGLASEER